MNILKADLIARRERAEYTHQEDRAGRPPQGQPEPPEAAVAVMPASPPRSEPAILTNLVGLYVMISINWFIDLLGLTFLFHMYLIGWHIVGLPLLLGTLLASGFAMFALLLAHRPLRMRRLSMPWTLVVPSVALIALCTGTILASYVFVDTTPWFDLGVLASWTLLTAGGVSLLTATFGVMDTIYVLARGVVMVVVGYLVAGPLHEAMFTYDVERGFYERHVKEIDQKIAGLPMQAGKDAEVDFNNCMQQVGLGEDLTCAAARQESASCDLVVAAWNYLKNKEENGNADALIRASLISQANEGPYASVRGQVLTIVDKNTTGKPGIKTRSKKLEREMKSDVDAGVAARKRVEACEEKRGTCSAHGAADNRNDRAREQLTKERNDYASRQIPMSSVDRAREFGRIMHEGSSGEAAEISAILNTRLRHAWILALLMPFLIVVVKLTSVRSQRREGY